MEYLKYQVLISVSNCSQGLPGSSGLDCLSTEETNMEPLK